ncbi:transmembrane protein, putative (macronuclear) [Tetrahymena thermophila SB210]|uniref:Transmembrane protein, putative n=1 Tax=Tetrahymena thermophila (strain SB210) TaxID=312017 RepID=W7XI77_TETTS|nr:transmembrane protein, putative [Tetrahymena thermophila SB210]EWS74381.1 transmembrane protein, putative [Tetrahymena thermophila SB210]|eukprot:XP_012653058.1 transmembrane protein, putative [Tetrahymena thermophila SB210]
MQNLSGIRIYKKYKQELLLKIFIISQLFKRVPQQFFARSHKFQIGSCKNYVLQISTSIEINILFLSVGILIIT